MSTFSSNMVQTPYKWGIWFRLREQAVELGIPVEPGKAIDIIDKTDDSLFAQIRDCLVQRRTGEQQLGPLAKDADGQVTLEVHGREVPLAWSPALFRGAKQAIGEQDAFFGFDRFHSQTMAALLGFDRFLRMHFERSGHALCPQCAATLSRGDLLHLRDTLEKRQRAVLLFAVPLRDKFFDGVSITLLELLSIYEVERVLVGRKLFSTHDFLAEFSAICSQPLQQFLQNDFSREVCLGLFTARVADLFDDYLMTQTEGEVNDWYRKGIHRIEVLSFHSRSSSGLKIFTLRNELFCEACQIIYSPYPRDDLQLLPENCIRVFSGTLTDLRDLTLDEAVQLANDERILVNHNLTQHLIQLGLGHLTLSKNVSELSPGAHQLLQIAYFLSLKLNHCMIMLGHLRGLLTDAQYNRALSYVCSCLRSNFLLTCGSHPPTSTHAHLSPLVLKVGISGLPELVPYAGEMLKEPRRSWVQIPFDDAFAKIEEEMDKAKLTVLSCVDVGFDSELLWKLCAHQLKHPKRRKDLLVRYVPACPPSLPRTKTLAEVGEIWTDFASYFASSQAARLLHLTTDDFDFSTSPYRCEQCRSLGGCLRCNETRFVGKILEVGVRGMSFGEAMKEPISNLVRRLELPGNLFNNLELLSKLGFAQSCLSRAASQLCASERIRLEFYHLFRKFRFKKRATKEVWLLDHALLELSAQYENMVLSDLVTCSEKGVSVICASSSKAAAELAHVRICITSEKRSRSIL